MRVEIERPSYNTKTNFINNKKLSFGNQMFMYEDEPEYEEEPKPSGLFGTISSNFSLNTEQETKTASSYSTTQKTEQEIKTTQDYQYRTTYNYGSYREEVVEEEKESKFEKFMIVVVDKLVDLKYLMGDVKDVVLEVFDNTKYTLAKVKDGVVDITKQQIRKIENNRENRRYQASMNWSKAAQKYLSLFIIKDEYYKQELCSIDGPDTVRKYKRAIKKLNKEIDHEMMMQNLEREFTKGKEYYNPSEPQDPFNPKDLEEIIPNKKYKSFDVELMRIVNLYLVNTSIIDNSSSDFKRLSGNYFTRAAESIKEICNIGADTKILERIPKLGIIPKALRIADQTRLIKCVKNDFDEVTKFYVEEGYVPLVDKYNSQYQIIKEFILQNCKNSIKNKEFSKKYVLTLNKTHDSRSKLTTNLLKSYSKAGVNLGAMCKQLNKNNTKDLVRKTITTFASFF